MSGISVFIPALVLKIVAMFTMLVDHIGLEVMNDASIYRFFGRTAFVLYAFLAAEGVVQTSRKNRPMHYMIRLLILASVSEIPYDLCMSGSVFVPDKNNVIFTIFLGCAACLITEYTLVRPVLEKKGILFLLSGIFVSTASAVMLCVTSMKLHTSYNYTGVLLILAFYLYLRCLADKPAAVRFIAIFAIITLYILRYTVFSYLSRENAARYIRLAFKKRTWIQTGSYIALPFILFYNREQGTHSRVFNWFYRLFYPVHLLLLYFYLTYLK